MKPHRREFFRTLAASVGGVSLARTVFAQNGAAAKLTDVKLSKVKLTDKMMLITGAGNNIVILPGDGGSLLVDCGDAAHAQDVLELTGRVNRVVNTHWHLASTGANDAMAKSGAKIMSQVSTELWMTQEIIHDWDKKVFPPRAKEALPTETFNTKGKTMFGGEPVEYGLLPKAHTDGDIYVHFTQSNVLVAGDAVQPGRLPLLDWPTGGRIGGMQAAQRTLLTLADDSTKIVPAVGPVMSKADLQASLDIVTKLRDHLVKLVRQGMGPQDLIEAKATQDFDSQLAGDPKIFLYTAYRGIWAHARELGGVL